VAAYALHCMLLAAGHESVFAGWGGFEAEHPEALLKLNDTEYELYTSCNFFDFSAATENVGNALTQILQHHKPEVIHLHHYVHIGIEVAALAKRLLPRCKVVLTLHEYLAICMNNGQMLTSRKELCEGYALDRCVQCFPHYSEADFFRRRLSVMSAFSYVDQFIAPSEFLRQRYVDWGLDSSKIHTIENPIESVLSKTYIPAAPPAREQPWVLGFFGQINYYKGLDLLLDGVELASSQGASVQLNIHGKFSDVTGVEYIEKLKARIESNPEIFRYFGPYAQVDVHELMVACHFITMGSRWYENSPVVIREAIATGRPLLVPELGGMSEKANASGMFFAANSPESLSNVLCGLNESDYLQLSEKASNRAQKEPACIADSFKKVLGIYQA
jgi:glycosyltransferase involved in cell wall biosynthesis